MWHIKDRMIENVEAFVTNNSFRHFPDGVGAKELSTWTLRFTNSELLRDMRSTRLEASVQAVDSSVIWTADFKTNTRNHLSPGSEALSVNMFTYLQVSCCNFALLLLGQCTGSFLTATFTSRNLWQINCRRQNFERNTSQLCSWFRSCFRFFYRVNLVVRWAMIWVVAEESRHTKYQFLQCYTLCVSPCLVGTMAKILVRKCWEKCQSLRHVTSSPDSASVTGERLLQFLNQRPRIHKNCLYICFKFGGAKAFLSR